ncbi:MAG: DNA pilot protein [Microvirus sp.]|nr:MAG: DNA pilot protein [Microvirus sp.]
MGFRSFFKKVGKVAKKALPFAAAALPFIPGVGPALGGVMSKVASGVGDLFGGSSASSANNFVGPPNPNQVTVTGQRPGTDWSSLVAPAIGGIASYYGQKQTNMSNAQQAQAQMDFQADQTGSSYQRGVADMKAAGLNPMLAYSQGGASSGGGAQASMGNELGAGANSAMSIAQARQQMAQSQAQIENINADTGNKEQQTTNLESENLYTLARTSTEGSRQHEIIQRIAQIALDNQLRAATQGYDISSARSGAHYKEAQAEGEKYSLAGKSSESGFFKSGFGRTYPYLSRATEQANSAANVFRKFIPFTND